MSAALSRAPWRAALDQWRALALVLALLGIWELYVDLGGVNSLILPAPGARGYVSSEPASLPKLWSAAASGVTSRP